MFVVYWIYGILTYAAGLHCFRVQNFAGQSQRFIRLHSTSDVTWTQKLATLSNISVQSFSDGMNHISNRKDYCLRCWVASRLFIERDQSHVSNISFADRHDRSSKSSSGCHEQQASNSLSTVCHARTMVRKSLVSETGLQIALRDLPT